VDIQLKHLQKRLEEQHLTLELSDAAKILLAREGYDPTYGARPLKRAIQKHVENPLAMEILEGHFSDGAHILADVDGGEIVFKTK
jgi:ATP-dependent Clp protease ATP-binding subunit ClpB